MGASAGLTLLPDRYSYDYGGHFVPGRDPAAPTLSCQVSGPVPLPERVPEVVWRAGIDLSPLDAARKEDVEWLRCFLWPGESGREERLLAAAASARRAPPTIYKGDLADDLATVAARAPSQATLVVYHTAVLAYADGAKRAAFADAVAGLGATWLSNEAPGVLPGVTAPVRGDHFLLVRDGAELLAATDPHGTWLRWLA